VVCEVTELVSRVGSLDEFIQHRLQSSPAAGEEVVESRLLESGRIAGGA
jgi:hypothetical protein